MTQVHIATGPPRRSLPERIEWARLLMAENGIRWTAWAALLGSLRGSSRLVERRMELLEKRHGLNGRTGRAVNYEYWQRWDWSRKGEEWTPSEAWKQSLINDVMRQHLEQGSTILEIGPGAGRWTDALRQIAGHLILVDLSDRCIELCRKRFGDVPNIEYHVNDGRSLGVISSGSVDGVWSFDVFVHVAPTDVDAYIGEIARVLRPGGRAVIHHAVGGREHSAADVGQRSNMTAADFAGMVRARNLTLVQQFDSWGDGARFTVTTRWDAISVIEK